MKSRYILLILCCLLAVIISAIACTQKPEQQFSYDPVKNYATFLVVDSDYGRMALASMKNNSVKENLEIGPIEFYSSGTQDFSPILTKLTASERVKVVWIISSIQDVNNIKTAQAALTFKGKYRYVPISDQTGPMKLSQ